MNKSVNELNKTEGVAEPPMVMAGPGDSIRIVPLYVPEDLTQLTVGATPPKLTYRGGPLLTSVRIFTVFWGTAWQTSPQSDLLSKVNQFFDFILTSPLIDQLSEYSVTGHSIGHGQRIGTATITSPKLRHSVTDHAIQHMLQQEISTNSAFPKPTSNTLYFVYLPPGVSVSQGGSRSCQAFCGYHENISGQIFYATMPYPGCTGCAGGLATFEALTSTSSHELCEAITDAVPGQGWYDDQNGEIGDICAWKTKQVGGYTVQLEWSNKANSCV
jgi:hypothetical protein